MTVSEPPSWKMAPPPLAVLLVLGTSLVKPSTNDRFRTVSSGVATFHALMMWRMREVPPPLSVTWPAPSMVVSLPTGTSEVTLMVTGAEPQLNVTMPPLATADRKAASVQLTALPLPTTVVGLDVSTGLAGTTQVAAGGGGLWSPPLPAAPPAASVPPVPPTPVAPPLPLIPPAASPAPPIATSGCAPGASGTPASPLPPLPPNPLLPPAPKAVLPPEPAPPKPSPPEPVVPPFLVALPAIPAVPPALVIPPEPVAPPAASVLPIDLVPPVLTVPPATFIPPVPVASTAPPPPAASFALAASLMPDE